ncbi:MAG: hypothetical protein FJZ11_02530, partial [Candidatus Omnitrophica bacterium]|nr:hypothetical protein [Candidatus Omnitrophota bacterium]
MFKRIRNKKGFLFPFAYVVLVAMTIYVAAFANRALNDSNITNRNISSIQSRYLAQLGIECAIREVQINGSSWYTHVAVKNGSIYDLIPVSEEQRPDVSLGFCEIKTSGPDAGCYAAKNGDFFVKSYKSPLSGATLFYSRGKSDNSSNTYAVKIQYKPLYEYFLFSPYELDLSH